MRTLTLLTLVFAGQANVYVLRERGAMWSSCPAALVLLATAGDVAFIACFALGSELMTPLARSGDWCSDIKLRLIDCGKLEVAREFDGDGLQDVALGDGACGENT